MNSPAETTVAVRLGHAHQAFIERRLTRAAVDNRLQNEVHSVFVQGDTNFVCNDDVSTARVFALNVDNMRHETTHTTGTCGVQRFETAA